MEFLAAVAVMYVMECQSIMMDDCQVYKEHEFIAADYITAKEECDEFKSVWVLTHRASTPHTAVFCE